MIDVPKGKVTAIVLGIMQDGGLPHLGCRCSRCAQAYEDPRKAEFAASLAVVDRRCDVDRVWLIDATPDIKYQLNSLGAFLGTRTSQPNRLNQPDGIFLTHADMGHIAGLSQFGPATMIVDKLKLYGAPAVLNLIRDADLWRNAEQLGFHPLEAASTIELGDDLTITPVPVPHTDDWAIGTFAFLIAGPEKLMLYLPDIDDWELWPRAREVVSSVDYALVDATFFGWEELSGRPPAAHPLVSETLSFFADLPCQFVLIHLNHTNPVLDPDSPEHKRVLDAGARVAKTGETFSL
jgi:pyrroloquinoline quinone biosynthesis protein B